MAYRSEKNEDNLNTTVFFPSILAILFMLGVVGLVWVTQLKPSTVAVETEPSATAETMVQKPASPAQVSAGNPEAGQKLFGSTCSACHGPAGEGIPGLGKDVTTSQFVASQNDSELVAFIKVGRDPSNPLNTTGIAMPPKGGNPALGDEDLVNIVAYIRAIRK